MSFVLVELDIYKAFSHDAHAEENTHIADLMLHYLHKKTAYYIYTDICINT